jgi:anti-anti-sigma factor
MPGANLSCQKVQDLPKVLVVCIAGEVDNDNISRQLESQFDAALQAEQPRHVLLDLGRLAFASTAFYSSLVFWQEDVTKKGGEFILFAVPASILSTMRIFTLDRKFKICADKPAALAALPPG